MSDFAELEVRLIMALFVVMVGLYACPAYQDRDDHTKMSPATSAGITVA
jgi:hypothetical protein